MIALAIGLQLADLATFGIASTFLPVAELERNPLMVVAFLALGLTGVALVKLSLLLLSLRLARRLNENRRKVGLGIIAVGGLVGAIANLSVMVLLG